MYSTNKVNQQFLCKSWSEGSKDCYRCNWIRSCQSSVFRWTSILNTCTVKKRGKSLIACIIHVLVFYPLIIQCSDNCSNLRTATTMSTHQEENKRRQKRTSALTWHFSMSLASATCLSCDMSMVCLVSKVSANQVRSSSVCKHSIENDSLHDKKNLHCNPGCR